MNCGTPNAAAAAAPHAAPVNCACIPTTNCGPIFTCGNISTG